jgi:hypothetical protein
MGLDAHRNYCWGLQKRFTNHYDLFGWLVAISSSLQEVMRGAPKICDFRTKTKSIIDRKN